MCAFSNNKIKCWQRVVSVSTDAANLEVFSSVWRKNKIQQVAMCRISAKKRKYEWLSSLCFILNCYQSLQQTGDLASTFHNIFGLLGEKGTNMFCVWNSRATQRELQLLLSLIRESHFSVWTYRNVSHFILSCRMWWFMLASRRLPK